MGVVFRFVAFIKFSRTASGAVSVQVVEKRAGKMVVLWHVGSAHDELSFSVLVEKASEFSWPVRR